mgnify:CR=1 FL=1
MNMGRNSGHFPTLVASLPRLPSDFEQPHVPISRPRLENRLQMLPEEELELVRLVDGFWRWEYQEREGPDIYAAMVSRIDNPAVLECIQVLADIRMLTVAVRARLRGGKPEAVVGRWGEHILRNWQTPDFGLVLRFPWLTEFRGLLENKDYAGAERRVCRIVWHEMARAAENHYFDLTVIISYLVRWDIINRWAVRDHARGVDRFTALVKEAIGDHAGKIE